MNKIQETNECERGEQLVAFLYGEAGERERADFEGHLAACAACRAELNAFAQVREAVGEWRAELLAHAPSVEAAEVLPAAAAPRVASTASAAGANRRTAWDALRESFALSPIWLRFGTAAAALVVCALAALAVLNARVSYANGSVAFSTGLRRETLKNNPAKPTTATSDPAQLNQLVAERDAALRQLEETRAQLEDSRAANIDAVYRDIAESQPEDASQSDQAPDPAPRARRAPAAQQRKPARRAQQSDDDLPRLIDLLSSGNE